MKVLFARVGWMKHYVGPVPGDEKPLGGGAFNRDNVGLEAYNFRPFGAGARLYGFCQPSIPADSTASIALERIDPSAEGADRLGDVLVVFVATRPKRGGQVIIGWYRHATVFRHMQSPPAGGPKEVRDEESCQSF
jgi:hypothetical protein